MTTESADAPHSAPFLPRPAAAPPGPVAVVPPRRTGRDPLSPPRPGRGLRHRTTAPLMAADGLATAGAAFLVPGPALLPALLGPTVLCLLVLNSQAGLYRPGLAPSALGDLPALLGRAAACWCAAAAALAALHPGRSLDPGALLCAPAVHTALACGARAAVYRARRAAARRRPRSALIVGADPTARQLATALHAHPEYGLRPVGLVAVGTVVPAVPAVPAMSEGHPEPELPLPRLVSAQDIVRAVIQNTVRDAVFTRPPEADPQTAALLRRFVDQGSTIWLAGAAAGYDGRPPRPGGEHLWGFACRRLDTGAPRHGGRAKRTVDIVLAAVLLAAAVPVLLGCALAVRVLDGPGVIFRQERTGRHGRTFTLFKFRTLRPCDAHESATRWSVPDDDRRMSRAGRLLRRTSLDELPQLWNVLRGDMSLVGPRPERPYFVQQFSQSYPDYAARHRMPAGITGLAQVHGLRGDTSIQDRARFDNLYIDGWSLWQDFLIMLRTAASLFRREGR